MISRWKQDGTPNGLVQEGPFSLDVKNIRGYFTSLSPVVSEELRLARPPSKAAPHNYEQLKAECLGPRRLVSRRCLQSASPRYTHNLKKKMSNSCRWSMM